MLLFTTTVTAKSSFSSAHNSQHKIFNFIIYLCCAFFALHKNVLIKTVRDEAGGHNWLQPFDPLKCIQKNFWHAKPIFVTL